jgi:trehalose 6-phosphate synthase
MAVWSKEALQQLIREKLRDYKFIVVSNREPYQHRRKNGGIEVVHPPGGLATGLDPIMRACGGVWVAHGSGDADRETVDANDRVQVPPDNPQYTLRRVWLTERQEELYYYRLANEGLWPLCHIAYTRPVFDPEAWQVYREVNRIFADAVLEEAGGSPTFVFVQDYHLALLPRMLKESNSNLIVAQFWHIPWPNREIFRIFPWPDELLNGMLGNDLLGFHLRHHCQNFLDTIDRAIEARVDPEMFTIDRAAHTTTVRPFPISIDFEQHERQARSEAVEREMEHWRGLLRSEGLFVGLGIDRIDYTKGIPDRLRAVDYFLREWPEYRERLIFVQVGVPSRSELPQYRGLAEEIETLVEEINSKWGTDSRKPVVFHPQPLGPVQMMALHRLSHFCVVSSLHDGMNLVAKEYVASRFDEDGVLILSRFTGAARELTDAILINPFNVEEGAAAIHEAIEVPEEERRKRMERMRSIVAANNIYRWGAKIVSELLKFDFPEHL